MFWELKRTVLLRLFLSTHKKMLWLKNKNNNFQLYILIWRPQLLACPVLMHYSWTSYLLKLSYNVKALQSLLSVLGHMINPYTKYIWLTFTKRGFPCYPFKMKYEPWGPYQVHIVLWNKFRDYRPQVENIGNVWSIIFNPFHTGKLVLWRTVKTLIHKAAFHQGLQCLLLKIKTIFRDRNTWFYRNLTLKYKMNKSIPIASICMV